MYNCTKNYQWMSKPLISIYQAWYSTIKTNVSQCFFLGKTLTHMGPGFDPINRQILIGMDDCLKWHSSVIGCSSPVADHWTLREQPIYVFQLIFLVSQCLVGCISIYCFHSSIMKSHPYQFDRGSQFQNSKCTHILTL